MKTLNLKDLQKEIFSVSRTIYPVSRTIYSVSRTIYSVSRTFSRPKRYDNSNRYLNRHN